MSLRKGEALAGRVHRVLGHFSLRVGRMEVPILHEAQTPLRVFPAPAPPPPAGPRRRASVADLPVVRPRAGGVGILVRLWRRAFGYDRPRALARRPSWETGATDTRSGSCLSARRSSGARARPSPSRDSAGPSPSSAPALTPSRRG